MKFLYKLTPVPGPVSVQFADDYLVDVTYIDDRTGAVLADFSGANAVLISTILPQMPPAVLQQFVDASAVQMVAVAKGVNLDG